MAFRHQAPRRRHIRNLLVASALGVLAQAYAAQAQTAGPNAGEVASAPDDATDQAAPAQTETGGAPRLGQLEDIIVTAQRRSQNLQDTPIAVTAFSARDLEERQVRSARDLITSTPNLQVQRVPGTDPNFVVFSIRGFNISRPLIGVQQPVGIYVDDFYYPSLSGSLLRVLDLSSVEVLRGPQGTLFGRNSLGGAVRYTTVAPGDELSGRADVTLGERERRDFTAAINLPIADFLAVRLSAGSLHQNGYVTDTTTGKPVGNSQNNVYRVQARLKPASDLTIDLTGEYVKNDFDGDPQVVGDITTTGAFDNPLAVTTGRAGAATDGGVVSADGRSVTFQRTFVPTLYNTGIGPFPAPAGPKYNSAYEGTCRYCSSGTTAPEYSRTRNQNLRGTIAWSPSDSINLKSLTSYFDIRNRYVTDTDRTPLASSLNVGGLDVKSFSQEFQVGGVLADDRLNYVAGLYYFNNAQDEFANTTGFPPVPRSSTASSRSNAYAIYAQGTFKLTPDFSATIGARQSWEDITVRSNTLTPPTSDFKGFTPTFKLQYQFAPDVMAYASASKGFRGGTVNTVDVRQAPQVPAAIALSEVQPDEAWSYEIGVRSEFFDRRLLVNITAFDAEYKNAQLVRAYAPPPGGLPIPATILENAGRSQFYGMELETQAVLGRLRLRGTLSLLHAEYKDIGTASDITLDSYIERTPKVTYSLGASYNIPIGEGGIQANLDYGWQARQVAGNQDHVTGFIPSYGVVNGRVAYQVNANLTLAATVTNLFDEFYLQNSANNRYYTGLYTYEPGEPRTFALSAQVKF